MYAVKINACHRKNRVADSHKNRHFVARVRRIAYGSGTFWDSFHTGVLRLLTIHPLNHLKESTTRKLLKGKSHKRVRPIVLDFIGHVTRQLWTTAQHKPTFGQLPNQCKEANNGSGYGADANAIRLCGCTTAHALYVFVSLADSDRLVSPRNSADLSNRTVPLK